MAKTITDFEQIVMQYAQNIATRYGTSVAWVSLDGQKDELKEYPQWRVYNEVKNYKFTWNNISSDKDVLISETIENKSSAEVKTIFKRTCTKSNTVSHATTNGLKVGLSIKANGGVNLEGIKAGLEIDTSTEYNFSATDTTEAKEDKMWEVDQEITQKCRARMDIEWDLERKNASGIFTAEISLWGNAAIWFNDRIDLNNPEGNDKHWLWFPSITSIVSEMKSEGFIIRGDRVIFNATGVMTADVGIVSHLVINETPLDVHAEVLESKVPISQTTEYVMDSKGKLLNMHNPGRD